MAVQTGEREEDAVEEVVAESAIHDHEERAEVFSTLTLAGLMLFSAGLLNGRTGQAMRVGSVAFALALTYVGYGVGHSGGALVYELGAAEAYGNGSGSARAEDASDHSENTERQSAKGVTGRVRHDPAPNP